MLDFIKILLSYIQDAFYFLLDIIKFIFLIPTYLIEIFSVLPTAISVPIIFLIGSMGIFVVIGIYNKLH